MRTNRKAMARARANRRFSWIADGGGMTRAKPIEWDAGNEAQGKKSGHHHTMAL